MGIVENPGLDDEVPAKDLLFSAPFLLESLWEVSANFLMLESTSWDKVWRCSAPTSACLFLQEFMNSEIHYQLPGIQNTDGNGPPEKKRDGE